jgi:hypothetical protein
MSDLRVVILPADGSFSKETFEAARNSLELFRRTGEANIEFYVDACFVLRCLENSKAILENKERVPDDPSLDALEVRAQHEAILQALHREFPEETELRDVVDSLVSFLGPICETGKLAPSGEDLFDELLIFLGQLASALKVTIH